MPLCAQSLLVACLMLIGAHGAGAQPVTTAPSPPATIAGTDSAQPRRRSVDVSDWYARRLTIHRYGSYAVLPLFGLQYVAGQQLYDKSSAAPGWAKTAHRGGATALAALFAVNTVTGVWNLWDSRSAPNGRRLRYAHAVTMLAADAGFTYAGARLAEQAETDMAKRRQHRTVALTSMGLTVAGGLMMAIWNR